MILIWRVMLDSVASVFPENTISMVHTTTSLYFACLFIKILIEKWEDSSWPRNFLSMH